MPFVFQLSSSWRGSNGMQNRRKFLTTPLSRHSLSEGYWLHVNRTAMACRFEVTLPLSDQTGVLVATDALNEVDRLEAQLTIFRQGSEVSWINRQAANEPVQVEASLFDLLLLCRRLQRE